MGETIKSNFEENLRNEIIKQSDNSTFKYVDYSSKVSLFIFNNLFV